MHRHGNRRNFRELVRPPSSLSAWLLAATLFFAAIPGVRLADTLAVCFVLFPLAVASGLIERVVRREYTAGRALRVAAAAYLLAGLLLTVSYLANVVAPTPGTADPLAIRGQGWVPVLTVNFMDFIWGRLGAQERPFLGLLLNIVMMPLALLAIRIRSWPEFRFILLAWAAGGLFGAAFAIAYCNGLIPGRVEFTWVYLNRAHGLTYHPNVLGINSLLTMLPLAMLLLECRNRLVVSAALIGILIAWMAIDYSGSRSAIGGVFLMAAAIAVARAQDRRSLQRTLALIAGLGGFAAIAILVVFPALNIGTGSALQRLISGSYGSDAAREIITRVVVGELWDNPVFGAGYQVMMVAHNIYLQMLHAAGAVGLLGFVLTLLVPLVLLHDHRAAPSEAVQIRACLTGGAIAFSCLYWVQSNPSYFGSALLFALATYAGLAHRSTVDFDPLSQSGEEPVELGSDTGRGPRVAM